MMKNRKKNGYTLVEVMVVVVIIALLVSVIVVSINRARLRTRDTIIISQVEQIQVLAETLYNPDTKYKELADMRGSVYEIADDHSTIRDIRQKIRDMGSFFRLFFPEDGEDAGFGEYCAYARLATDENKVFCVDSLGNERKAVLDNINCQAMARPANCEDMQ